MRGVLFADLNRCFIEIIAEQPVPLFPFKAVPFNIVLITFYPV